MSEPAKFPAWAGILLAVLALMCVIDWSITAVTLTYAIISGNLFLLGLFVGSYSMRIGYLIAILICSWIIYRAQTKSYWQLAWIGLLLFSIMIAAEMYLHVSWRLPYYALRMCLREVERIRPLSLHFKKTAPLRHQISASSLNSP
jgi:hypothetical protein